MKDEAKIAAEAMERNLHNLKTEAEMYPKKLDHVNTLISMLSERIDIRQQIHEIVLAGLKKKESAKNWQYEDSEAYWKKQRELMDLDWFAEKYKMQQELENLETGAAKINEEIARINKEIPRIEAEIAGLKGE